jgi:hypothetical protein
VATKKISKVAAEPKTRMPSPREKLKIKTTVKDDDWYDVAFKRFSISLNRTNQQHDLLATLTPPIKSGLQ